MNFKMARTVSWLVGAMVICALVIGFVGDSGMFLRAWLFGWYFWFSLTMGCMALLMLQYVIHGEWGFVIRRQLEAAASTLPAMAVLFIPVLLGVKGIYEWAMGHMPGESEAIYNFKYIWLQIPFFTVRSVLYFIIFLALLRPLLAWSRSDDEAGAPVRGARLSALGAGGLIAFFLVMTLAAIDWIMSLEPEWHSTVFGAQLIMGQAVMGVSFAVISTVWLKRSEPLRGIVRTIHINDLGNLMLAFVMLWIYMAFVQYLIIWNGNLREDNVWFIHRSRGVWPYVAAALAIVHFGVPFAILLSRTAKRNGAIMFGVATLLIVAHAADCFWLIAPNFTDGRDRLSWMDLAAVIGIGGVWVGFYFHRIAALPLLPAHDERFEYMSRRTAEGQA